MKKALTQAFWVFSTLYGRIFARRLFVGFHRTLLNLSLHGLGYDNCAGFNATGEQWFVRSILKKEDIRVAVDIGANIGTYAHELLETLKCEVYALEPAASTFTELHSMTSRFPSLHAIQAAASDTDGTATLFSNPGHSENASLAIESMYQPEYAENVPVYRIDTLVKEKSINRIDFIKIDTEGFELETLRGMQNTLKELRPKFIQFEFNILHLYRGHTLRQLTDMLPGYTFYRLLPRDWIPIDPSRFRDNIFMYCNIIAVRK